MDCGTIAQRFLYFVVLPFRAGSNKGSANYHFYAFAFDKASDQTDHSQLLEFPLIAISYIHACFIISVLYGLITFCLFLLLPFMYFFYEEREEDVSCKSVSF